MDLALLIIAAKVFLKKDDISDVEKFCGDMAPGSPAHLQCIETFQRLE